MGPGLQAEFYNQVRLIDFPVVADTELPTLRRTDGVMDFPLANNGIAGANSGVTTVFYVRWRGRMRIGRMGNYSFHLAANDAARLFIDGRNIVESIKPNVIGNSALPDGEKTETVSLEAGDHELLLELYNGTGRDGLRLAWTPEGGAKVVIPADVLFHERARLQTLTVIADAQGRFRFPKASPGRYTLRAQVRGGFAEWEQGREVTVEADKQLTGLDFTLAPFKKGNWKYYTQADGLAHDSVQCIFQAADGAMWFGTRGGVSRFDGSRALVTLTREQGLPDTSVRAIHEGKNGVMWFGTPNGLCRYDPRTSARPFQSFTSKDGLAGDEVTALVQDKAGNLWIGTGTGVSRYDGKSFVNFHGPRVVDSGPAGRHGRLVGNARIVESLRPTLSDKPQPTITEKVLQLHGNGSYVELPPNIFSALTEVTVEGWVKWDGFHWYSRFFDFGRRDLAFFVGQLERNSDLIFQVWPDSSGYLELRVPGALRLGEWCHIAAVADQKGFRLYLNGNMAAQSPWVAPLHAPGGRIIGQHKPSNSVKPIANGEHIYLGRSNWHDAPTGADADLQGEMHEVRLWKTARTEEEIRGHMSRRLTGSEPGLVGLWNFEDGTARDRTPNGHNGKLVGRAQIVEVQRPGVAVAPLVARETVLELDGKNSFVDLGAAAPVLRMPFTMEAWIRPTTDRWAAFLGGGGTAADWLRAPCLYVRPGAAVHGGFGTGKDWRAWNTPNGVLSIGGWNHVAFTCDGKTQRVYVNGVQVHEMPTIDLPIAEPVRWIGRAHL